MTEAYIRQVHQDMFNGVWEWAGKYRTTQTNLGLAPKAIPEEVMKLVKDVAFWRDSGIPILERAVRLHHRLAWIHPFPNGKGRHARLISDIYLYSYQCPLPTWPEKDLLGAGSTRAQYLNALRKADQGNFHALIRFTKNAS